MRLQGSSSRTRHNLQGHAGKNRVRGRVISTPFLTLKTLEKQKSYGGGITINLFQDVWWKIGRPGAADVKGRSPHIFISLCHHEAEHVVDFTRKNQAVALAHCL